MKKGTTMRKDKLTDVFYNMIIIILVIHVTCYKPK